MTSADRTLTAAPVTGSAADGDAPAWKPLAALLAGSGVLHFVVPKPYESIVPKALGDPAPYVRWSGVAELACAAGLALPRTRRLAGLASAALFIGVFPANVYMAQRDVRSPRTNPLWKAGVLARLPLQVPMVTRSLGIARAKGSR